MIHIANPIYDSVFKYLMEDERVARTIFSALLKKEVVSVEMRRNEYANVGRRDISMFRIDFGAKVREADGRVHLVLIELQKTWLPTETLRFRQYLGAQYSNQENMLKEDLAPSRYAIPMVAVYLLGHLVGNITEPVLYVKHKAYNYEGHEVTEGMPDPFVESLTHDSIIVQIPRLHGRINNRLDRVLSVFDQTQKEKGNPRMIRLDETLYADDSDMRHILHRLTSASTDEKLRRDMEVEDEFLSVVEEYDTTIMKQQEELKTMGHQLAAQGSQLEKANRQLLEQSDRLQEQNDKLQEQKDKLRATARLLRESGMNVQAIAEATGLSSEEIEKI